MIGDKYLETRERSFMSIKKGVAQEWSIVVPHILISVNLYFSIR